MTVERPRFALDTNILIYTSDDSAGPKQAVARNVLARAAICGRCMLSMQSVGEFFHAITRKRRASPEAAARRARDFIALFPVAEPTTPDTATALDLAVAGASSYWDGLLLATIGRTGCAVLLSEDMQNGARIAGVTVLNPFVGDVLPDAIAALLD